MKTLTFTVLLLSVCFGRTIDSIGVFPFGPGLDLRKNLTIEDIIKEFGRPQSIDTINKTKPDFNAHYSNKTFYFIKGRLYYIEIKKGEFQDLEIGMSKEEIRTTYGPCTIVDTVLNSETQEFGYYDQDWVRYITTLFIENKRLIKIAITREDFWL
jgi:hypothetical protein